MLEYALCRVYYMLVLYKTVLQIYLHVFPYGMVVPTNSFARRSNSQYMAVRSLSSCMYMYVEHYVYC